MFLVLYKKQLSLTILKLVYPLNIGYWGSGSPSVAKNRSLPGTVAAW